jgi:hypothetical protein
MGSRDWRPEIVRLVEIKQAISEVDVDGLWEFHLPRVAASRASVDAAERVLGARLDDSFRSFLGHANGWPSFFQSVDLFGTDDLAGGPRFDVASSLLDAIEPEALAVAGLVRSELVPIAATMVDLDVFVMRVVDGQLCGPVVWLAGYEIDRFATFDDFVSAMIAYNENELDVMQSQR